MGLNAVYIAIDDDTAGELWALEDGPFRDRILEIEEDEGLRRLDIAKTWDVLHCTLTGVSASRPIEDDKRSEAIVGVHPREFDDGDDSFFVSITDHSEIGEILAALDAVTEAELAERFDPPRLRKQKVYPHGIWNDDPDTLLREFTEALASMREFLSKARAEGSHVLVTIL